VQIKEVFVRALAIFKAMVQALRILYAPNQLQEGEYDCYVYSHTFDDSHMIILMPYVDDMLIACRDMLKIKELKRILSREFDMKDLDAAKWRLKETGKMGGCLSPDKYINKVLEKFNMVDAKPVFTPLASHFVLNAKQSLSTEVELEEMKKIPYASAMGCLMYVMVCTMPDLTQAMSVVLKIYVKYR